MTPGSKHGHESTLYWSVRDDIDVVGMLRLRAFQRHQYRRERSNIRSIHGRVLIRESFIAVVIHRCHRTPDEKINKNNGYEFIQ